MSIAYDDYIVVHKDCVMKAVKWIFSRIPSEKLNDIFPQLNTMQLAENVEMHDQSKYSLAEYGPYDSYFYGERTDTVEEAFDYAWLSHLHRNPHHWQYWVLKEDDAPATDSMMSIKCLEIPDVYILEMIADWWSFSWKNYLASHDKSDLYEIFNWYNDHTDKIAMNSKSREKVETVLNLIRDSLDESSNIIEFV